MNNDYPVNLSLVTQLSTKQRTYPYFLFFIFNNNLKGFWGFGVLGFVVCCLLFVDYFYYYCLDIYV